MNQLPEASSYRATALNPHLCFADPELKQGQVAKNKLGLALVWSGQAAIVFRLQTPEGIRAVRCFTSHISDQQERYAKLNQHVQERYVPTLVDFEYQAKGMQVNGTWYPIVKMEWVDGIALDQQVAAWIRGGNIARLDALAQHWANVIAELQQAQIAHGDLQHENILIGLGSVGGHSYINLVDYDGVYVPSLADKPALEIGHPHYQHPDRTSGDFDLSLDNFSALVIYLSLKALAVDPSLWMKFHEDKHLIFLADDFKAPASSPLIDTLKRSLDADVRRLTAALERYAAGPMTAVPPLRAVLNGAAARSFAGPGGSWIKSWKQAEDLLTPPATSMPVPVDQMEEDLPDLGGSSEDLQRPSYTRDESGKFAVTPREVLEAQLERGDQSATPSSEVARRSWLDRLMGRQLFSGLAQWFSRGQSERVDTTPIDTGVPAADVPAFKSEAPAANVGFGRLGYQAKHLLTATGLKTDDQTLETDITPLLQMHLEDHPLAKDRRVYVELERLLDIGAAPWEGAKLTLLKQAQAPRSITELRVRTIARGLFVRVVLRVQLEERYEVRVIRTPSPRFYRRLLGEMESYDLDREGQNVPVLETYQASQAKPGTYDRVPCKRCNGTGYQSSLCQTCDGAGTLARPNGRVARCPTCDGTGAVQKKCRVCRDGDLESYFKDIKHIYPETWMLSDFLYVDKGLGVYEKPSQNFEVLWESPVVDAPFGALPFQISGRRANAGGSGALAGAQVSLDDLEAALERTLNKVEHRIQNAEIEHDTTLQPLDSVISAVFGSIYEEGAPLNARVAAKRFQIAVEVTPIYKVHYDREVTYVTRRFLIFPKTNVSLVEGELYLQGPGNLDAYAHREWQHS